MKTKILMIPMLMMIALSACDNEPTSNVPKTPTGLSAYKRLLLCLRN